MWPPRALCLIALIALAAKLALAATTFGTNDVATWMRFAREVSGSDGAHLYALDPEFNHPPFMVHALELLAWLTDRHWFSFEFLLRLPGIFADLGSLFLVYHITSRRSGVAPSNFELGIIAAAPISLFVSGFHGNTDPVMVFFLLLAVWWIDSPERIVWAGAAFGMSMSIKIVPLAFVPAALLYLPTFRRRLEFIVPAAIVVLVSSMPVLAQEPGVVVPRVLGYGTIFGHWGLARIATMLPANLGVAEAVRIHGAQALLALLIALSIWMNCGRAKPTFYVQCGVIAFALLTFSAGFGIQYLAWLVPWTVGVRRSVVLSFHAACGAFLFGVYTYWSRGLPWYYANSTAVGDWGLNVVPFELAAWVSVAIVFGFLLSNAAAERRSAAVRAASM
jgi:hypothetical protein